ncbi:hypothetical protein GOARA_063_01060 [Gordonia araii NBRC 100433]|uniref:Uncharacterized protein n=1 Tax=Gordonia araii NBRC 100433 TaxID=1073574 RepID=G7H4Y2_9ACTN|nr:hypothetical protein [Gordonia araii]NNG96597.1 hypothetical protein [Gordonia araii NBRC 100433]GAB10907.1 hypothetical protein GOARA_063_01060 [Gordonia araii NBRC 100433]
MTSLSRRTLLRGAAAATVAVPLGAVALSACSSEPSPEEVLAGRLVPLASAAAASAATARQLRAVDTRNAAALDQIAAIRAEHEKLLRDEITRLHPSSASLISTPSAAPTPAAPGTSTPRTSAPGTTSAPPSPAPGIEQFGTSLTADADSAGKVATTTSGFQAGLTASISASIASLKGLLP